MVTGDRRAQDALDAVFAAEWPRLVGYALRIVRDLDAAEEIVQEAMVAALRRWPFDGVPEKPAAWLTTACRNRALNHVRDTARRRDREGPGIEQLTVFDVVGEHRGPLEDDRLRLIFLCCHPRLPRQAQVALTLRMVAGLATPDIARAFLVSEATMAQRITRAKRAVVEQGISLELPPDSELGERLASVIDVLYLIFNEGYLARSGDSLQRVELAAEAHRLAILLAALLPDRPQPWALLALIALQRSRSAARVGPTGELVTLDSQDRAGWDSALIDSGLAALRSATSFGIREPLLIQAEIAACHAAAPAWPATDWTRILALYDELCELAPSPLLAMNRAVAVCMVEGPAVALQTLDDLPDADELRRHHLFWATRADFLSRMGRTGESVDAYRTAATLTSNGAELDHLARRIQQAEGAPSASTTRGGTADGTR